MNFQRLIGLLSKSQDNGLFQDIVGYDHIKRLFNMALESDSSTHILLTGPPASAKTMFLASLLRSLKNAYFVDGGNATKAGMIDYLFENRPRYLLIDEIDKLPTHNQTFLLNLMETGIISESTERQENQNWIPQYSLQVTILGNYLVLCSLDSLWWNWNHILMINSMKLHYVY